MRRNPFATLGCVVPQSILEEGIRIRRAETFLQLSGGAAAVDEARKIAAATGMTYEDAIADVRRRL